MLKLMGLCLTSLLLRSLSQLKIIIFTFTILHPPVEVVKGYFEKLEVEAAFTPQNRQLEKLDLTFMKISCQLMAQM